MTRPPVAAAVVALALVLVSPAPAQGEELPTELWSEYPLVPEVERAAPPSAGPLLPPTVPDAERASSDAPPWTLWALVATAGLIAALAATRVVRHAPVRRARDGDAAVRLRPAPLQAPRSSRSTPLAQYAPRRSLAPTGERDPPRRSVVRRTGLLRSRFVVLAGDPSVEPETVASSRGFWNVGLGRSRERVAEDAWDDLLNDLRASGWEPDPARGSDFYVVLQPAEPAESSIVPTLEAYGRSVDDAGADDS